MDTSRHSQTSKNLINTGTGYYISLNDTGIYEKIQRNKFRDGKFLFNAALALEKQAEQHLSAYRKTRKKSYYRNYIKRLAESMSVMRESWKSGYTYAAMEILRLDKKMNRQSRVHNQYFFNIIDFSTLLLLCLFIGMLIPAFLYFFLR